MYDSTRPPAEQLQGVTLSDGWHVTAKLDRPPAATGGFFSIGYVVHSDRGQRGFLKALDFLSALSALDPAAEFQRLTSAFLFERDVCQACAQRSFDRVVVAVASGRIMLDDANPHSVVQYIIFELADCDIRQHLDTLATMDLPWALRSLHHVAVGLRQLHTAEIAHQDLKPSNVLVFEGTTSKIGDLGRAACRSLSSPFDALDCAGDRHYAPPELLYGFASPEWNERRLGCDLYLLGSMVTFLFSRAPMTGLLFTYLHPDYHFTKWNGTFSEILPFLRQAFDEALEAIEVDFPAAARADLTTLVRWLCDPDPGRRGHPQEQVPGRNRQSLERIVSTLDLLASRAERGVRRS